MSLSNAVYKYGKTLNINDTKYDDINRITTRVFIGNYHAARDKDIFDKYNIKDLPNSFRGRSDIEYMRIPIDDSLREVDFKKLLDFFPVVTKFIEKHANIQKQNILVHCVEGSQRSCSSVVAYLMEMYNMSPISACELVLSKRHKAFHHGTNVNFEKSINSYNSHLRKRRR